MWIHFGYEQHHYFGIHGEPLFVNQMDIYSDFTTSLASFPEGEVKEVDLVPITFTCDWGGGNLSQFLKPPPKKKYNIAFMASNCGTGGAHVRASYVKELMKYIHVDSLGGCLRNKNLPKGKNQPIYDDHGAAMRWKVEIFSEYKMVLTFEVSLPFFIRYWNVIGWKEQQCDRLCH